MQEVWEVKLGGCELDEQEALGREDAAEAEGGAW